MSYFVQFHRHTLDQLSKQCDDQGKLLNDCLVTLKEIRQLGYQECLRAYLSYQLTRCGDLAEKQIAALEAAGVEVREEEG